MATGKRIDEQRNIDVERIRQIEIERNRVTGQRDRDEQKVREIEREKQDRKK
ncbi:MAG TPA: hypothetical protein VEO54_25770 [Thermoanaerobaculia bacterium]|nr:hypothetical protein [Thermoanaerobaculia bacterium]